MIDIAKLSPAQPEGGLSSFANLVRMFLGFDETQEEFCFANYLSCLGLMPESGPKPTHPLYFQTSFPPEGPMEILPRDVADRMEDSFSELRKIRSRLADYGSSDEITPEATDECGRKAIAAVRRIGTALGSRRWGSGETMVKTLQLTKSLPATDIEGAELVQAFNESGSDICVWEDLENSHNKVHVSATRLVFRLVESESIEMVTPAKLEELRKRSELIGAVYNALFPEEHCIIEFRDQTAATLSRSEPIGPSYSKVVAKREANRSTAD